MLTFFLSALFSGLLYSEPLKPYSAEDSRHSVVDSIQIAHADSEQTLEEFLASGAQFHPLSAKSIFSASPRDHIWIRLLVERTDADRGEYYFVIQDPSISNIRFYRGSLFAATGSSMRFSQRMLQTQFYAFPVFGNPNTSSEIYIYLQSDRGIRFTPMVVSEARLIELSQGLNLISGAFYGSLFLLALVSLGVGVQRKNSSAYSLSAVIVLFGFWQFTMDGLAHLLLWPDFPQWNHAADFLLLDLLGVSLLIFSRLYLFREPGNHVHFGKSETVLFVLVILHLTAGLVIPYQYNIFISQALISLIGVNAIRLSILSRDKGAGRRVYQLAWMIFAAATLLQAVQEYTANGILPAYWNLQKATGIVAIFSMILAIIARSSLSREQTETENKKWEANISPFVPREFINLLGTDSIQNLRSGKSLERNLTIMFVDIRQFSTLSEKLSATDTVSFLNEYLVHMTPIIQGSKGIVDKFIGDAIMALFPGGAEDALKAAISIRMELTLYNANRISQEKSPIEIGIGIHSGSVALGAIGTDERLQTTVIGDNVNLAARIESLTKVFHTPLLITDSAFKELKNPSLYFLREIDSIRVKGKQNPVVVYECFDADPKKLIEQKNAVISDFALGVALYKAGDFSEAQSVFQNAEHSAPDDPLPKTYAHRCEYLIAHPPGKKWTGISRLANRK